MPGARDKIGSMLTIWRRHTASCPHRTKGRNSLKCCCPLWADGYVDGKRVLRQSLETRDMARARKKAVALEVAGRGVFKPVADAVTAFIAIAKAKAENLDDPQVPEYSEHISKHSAKSGALKPWGS